jgi:sugar phosphate isomerase/epimerase
LTVLLGNSGSPRWYSGEDRTLERYLDSLVAWGATSAEIVLHHGPFDERTARVHVIEPDWSETVSAYQRRGLAVQLHVSLDQRFATSRWRDDREGLMDEFEPILALASVIAESQERVVLVLHGASDQAATLDQNEASTAGLLDWLATRFETSSLPACAGLELGAAKDGRETATARARASVFGLVEQVASPQVGICWDLAHDRENSAREADWTERPSDEFLRRVVHVHLHDLDDQGMAHYPLLLGNVPFERQLAALAEVKSLPSLTMEVRWLCAVRMGEPWEMLARSYEAVWSALRRIEEH